MNIGIILKRTGMESNLSLKQHFTDAPQINDMMCHLLGPVDGMTLLEPSVGHGAFLRGLIGDPREIHAVDVDEVAIETVRAKFKHLNVHVFKEDFVDLFVDGLLKQSHPVRTQLYDLVISNPPYGLYFDLDYRKRIKRAFPNSYARESYGLFFTFAVSQLREGGRYVFLVPDTFLSSVNHRPLRSFICSHAAPTHILRFPSKLFETVNFGYGNLCILAGQKRALTNRDSVRWLDVFGKHSALSVATLSRAKSITGEKLMECAESGWSPAIFDSSSERLARWVTLGEIADCRTGIYTGDNERFIGYDASRITRRLNGHSIDWEREVYDRILSDGEQKFGLESGRHYAPLIRGGHREPFDKTAWAIDWRQEAIEFYRTDKKARLQNSTFYFREGLSVPMVTTKRISAALMNNAVFDQGVVGVFPRCQTETSALLLYLNSAIASQKMKTLVNGSANNSANYLKRLPVPRFSQADRLHATQLVDSSRQRECLSQSVCDTFIEAVLDALPD
jgi:adenine-specific DNA-methyltransferase